MIGEVVTNPNLTILEVTLREFRQFLLNNNISEDDVNSLTDNDLLALLSALNESGLNEGNVEELTAEEVREFLLNQPGANIAEINSLSAETFKYLINR